MCLLETKENDAFLCVYYIETPTDSSKNLIPHPNYLFISLGKLKIHQDKVLHSSQILGIHFKTSVKRA